MRAGVLGAMVLTILVAESSAFSPSAPQLVSSSALRLSSSERSFSQNKPASSRRRFRVTCSAAGQEVPEAAGRRKMLRSVMFGVLSTLPLVAQAEGADKQYTGPSAYGFKFRYPAAWKPNKKTGNKHLYDLEVRPKDGRGQITMTVDQVKINAMADFGKIDEIGEKLRGQVEKQLKGQKVQLVKAFRSISNDKMEYYNIDLARSNHQTPNPPTHDTLQPLPGALHPQTLCPTGEPETVNQAWEGGKQSTKMTITAQQLFALSVTTGGGQEDLTSQITASFAVKPNYVENFQPYGKGQAPEVADFLFRLPSDFVKMEQGDF